MKKLNLKTLFVSLALCAPLTVAAQDIAINEENFPDANFRSYLLENYGRDGVIPEEDIEGITSIIVDFKNISNLKGIEHFPALKELFCEYNLLTTLDVSKNTELTHLWCSNNLITTLDVSGCTALTTLGCSDNLFTTLDVSNNTALTQLYCYDNLLTTLGVSNNTALTQLYCWNNKLTSLNVSGCTALVSLSCNNNQLTSLNVSGCTALIDLSCSTNKLTALDVTGCTALRELYCFINQIKGEFMDAFVSSLPETARGRLYVYNDWIGEDNVITTSQVAEAKAKGWISYYAPNGGSQWIEYEGMDDTATSIALPEVEDGTATVYTLQGQKVTTPQKGGIYVINGKKVVVK